MKLASLLVIVLMSIQLGVSAEPEVGSGAEARAAAVAKRRAETLETLARYTWTSRSEALKKDKVHTTIVETVSYDPQSGITRKLVSRQSPDKKKKEGPSGERLQSKEDKLDAWIGRLETAFSPYLLISPDAVREVVLRAGDSVDGSDALSRVHADGVIEAEDVVTLWIDAKTQDVLRVHVFARFEGEDATIVTDYERLGDGLVFPARWRIFLPGSRFEMRVENSGPVRGRAE